MYLKMKTYLTKLDRKHFANEDFTVATVHMSFHIS